VYIFLTLRLNPTGTKRFNAFRRLLQVMLGGLFALGCVTALGQGQDEDTENQAGFNFRVRNEFSYDDNILSIPDGDLGSRIWELAPDVNLTMQNGGSMLNMDVGVIHRNYLDSQIDTYTSKQAAVNWQQWVGDSLRLNYRVSLNNTFEQRGSGANEGQNALSVSAPTPLDTAQNQFGIQLGSEQSKIRLNATFSDTELDRRSPIITNDATDNNERQNSYSMNYKFGRRTDLIAELRTRKFSYPNEFVNQDGTRFSRDSTEELVILGADLAATAVTGGRVRVGKVKREFAWKSARWDGEAEALPTQSGAVATGNPAVLPLEDQSDLYWELVAIWNIKSYSRLELSTESRTQEALLVGSYIRNRNVTLRWTHLWSENLQSIIDFTFGTDVYKGTERTDDRSVYNLRLEYAIDDWLRMGLGMRHQTLDSPFTTVGYEKNIFYIFATYSNGYGN
jgi:hypothetical protein